MRTLVLSILVPVVVLLAWGLLFFVLDRSNAAQSRAETRRAENSQRRQRQQGEIDGDESEQA
jgi:uncharacterized membrane protein